MKQQVEEVFLLKYVKDEGTKDKVLLKSVTRYFCQDKLIL